MTADILTTHVLSYADNENINHSTRKCLVEFAGNYGTVQDYRQAQVSCKRFLKHYICICLLRELVGVG